MATKSVTEASPLVVEKQPPRAYAPSPEKWQTIVGVIGCFIATVGAATAAAVLFHMPPPPPSPPPVQIRFWEHNCSHRVNVSGVSQRLDDLGRMPLTCLHNGAVARGDMVIGATRPCGWYAADASAHQDCAAKQLIEQIQRGDITSKQLQLVVNRYDEDISWSDEFDRIRVVYDKSAVPLQAGDQPGPTHVVYLHTGLSHSAHAASGPSRVVPTINVGREGQTFLKHIVDNYHQLADRTVFMHGSEPSCGFFFKANEEKGNHLMLNVSVTDYMVSTSPVFAPATVAWDQHLTVFTQRRGFADTPPGEEKRGFTPSYTIRPPKLYPYRNEWLPWEQNDWLGQVYNYAEEAGTPDEMGWEEAYRFVTNSSEADPMPEVFYIAQGAQVSATREAIHRRPLEHYQKILDYMSDPTQPRTAFGYWLEFLWPQMLKMEVPLAGAEDAVPQPPADRSQALRFGETEYAWNDFVRAPACANELYNELQNNDADATFTLPTFNGATLYLRDYATTVWQRVPLEKSLDARLLVRLLRGHEVGNSCRYGCLQEIQKHLSGEGAITIEWDKHYKPTWRLLEGAPRDFPLNATFRAVGDLREARLQGAFHERNHGETLDEDGTEDILRAAAAESPYGGDRTHTGRS